MDYTTMARVFQKGSKDLISKKLYQDLIDLNTWASESTYKINHREFCKWFISSVRRARTGGRPSWGHAAKVMDISMKVFIYYCSLPSGAKAAHILPWLNGAVDGPIIQKLSTDFTGKYSTLRSVTLNNMSMKKYNLLQLLIRERAAKEGLLPVEWEEITWRDLNRRSVNK